jgi:hypothetical protein
MSEPITLTDGQKQTIVDRWNADPKSPPSIKDLTEVAFGKILDARTQEGIAVKEFLATLNMKPKTRGNKGDIRLDDNQKKFIDSYAKTMRPHEIARELWKNPKLSHVSQEARTVRNYIDVEGKAGDAIAPLNVEKYRPPKTLKQVVSTINTFTSVEWKDEDLKAMEKKNCLSLITYMTTHRLVKQLSNYADSEERELFESCFVRFCYDKNDLTQEEVDQYVNLCTEIIISRRIQERVELFQGWLEDKADGDSDGKVSPMACIEAISTAQGEYNQCVNRQNKLKESLTGSRAKRIDSKIREHASVLNFFEAWRQDENFRDRMLQAGRDREKELGDEIDDMGAVDEAKSIIMGISKEEAMFG